MPILNARDLSKRYGERVLLGAVSFTLEPGERVGVVGHNGSGKSTLARILAGLDEPDSGQVVYARGIRLQYLEQDPDLPAEATALEVVLTGLDAWSQAVARHGELSSAIAEANPEAMGRLLDEQAEVAAEVERLGGWQQEHRAEAMLGHLGVNTPGQRVGTMSGGERRRVALARLLVSQPEVAILDEPTNHLDIDTIEWLEDHLSERYPGAVVLITHDRYLLSRVVTRTFEVDAGEVHGYEGGWERYLAAKAERQAHAERVAANRKNILRRELEWMRRQPKARTTKSKARTDRVQELIDSGGLAHARTVSFKLQGQRSGNTILDIDDLAVDIAGRRLLAGLTFNLGKRERVGIVGPNGCGKTTLLRVLLGDLEPAGGTVRLGKNTRIAYLDQQRSGLDEQATVYDSVAEGRSHIRLGDNDITVYSYLERFMFKPLAQAQKIATLSGGERARVALAKLLADKSNLVVLDEPTNDLDVATLSALEDTLESFAGSVICVTHDRYFLDRVATSILAFERPDRSDASSNDGGAADAETQPSRAVHVQGNYQRYLDYRAIKEREAAQAAAEAAAQAAAKAARKLKPATAASAPTVVPARKALTYGEEIELTSLPERIDQAEQTVAALEAEMAAPDFHARDHTEQAAFFTRVSAAKDEADALVERWADLEARSESE